MGFKALGTAEFRVKFRVLQMVINIHEVHLSRSGSNAIAVVVVIVVVVVVVESACCDTSESPSSFSLPPQP